MMRGRCLTGSICASAMAMMAWLSGCVSPEVARVMPPLQPKVDPDALILYVSATGNDAWSGELPEANEGQTDGPYATITRARDRIREVKASAEGLSRPVTVLIRDGVYRQVEPFVFTPNDSGTEACPITYQAYPGEIPVISGGRRILDWEHDDTEHSRMMCDGKLWRAHVPMQDNGRAWRFNQLYVNGRRRIRARSPNKGSFFRTDGPISKSSSRGFYFQEGDIEEWDRLRDIIAVVYHSWETSIHHLRSVDTEAQRVTFWEPAPWAMGRWEKNQRYYIENVFEGLDEPGEWYLDRSTHILYYYPLPGERMDEVEVTAPVITSTLIDFKADASKGETIEYIHMRGLSFQHTDSQLNRIRNPGQGEIYQPAMIMASGLRHSSFEGCYVGQTGAHGLWMGDGCSDTVIRQCHIHDLAGGGVYIGGGWGVQSSTPVERITVDNCFIHDGGHLFHGAHGVWIGRSSYNNVTHNEISNFDYSGISCGWSWGFAPSSANNNHLDYNHIHHLSNGEGLSDMGGIYTLGVSPGTTERYNHMHHIYSYAHVSHGSGVYPDEGSSEILIENNVVHHVRTCPLFQHYGKDNIVRNNILAFGGRGQLQRCREDKPCHYIAEGNIVYADIRQMLGGVWQSGDWKLGRNVYWSTAGEPQFKDMTFEEWQAKGYDEGSIVADPKFVNPEKGDFRLKPDSPALTLGFEPIDMNKIGLYGDSDWVALPTKYTNRPRNDIPAPIVPPFVINLDFDADQSGDEPLDGKVVSGQNNAAIEVSTEVAASGTQSLKFSDAPDQQFEWTPHIYYNPSYEEGDLTLSWDMLNSKESPASFYVEVRQWDVRPYLVGPTVTVTPDGTVTASETEVGTIPLGEWVHVSIAIELGKNAPDSYVLTLHVPGREPKIVEVPYLNADFKKITWLGISSTSEQASIFYIDNLKLGTAEELARPPKRRRSTRRKVQKEGPIEPANPESLMGYWRFEEGEGYVAEDSSGYDNYGEVWGIWAEGAFGSAMYFEPTANSVVVPDHPTLQLGTSSFSIELWMCPTQLAIDADDKRRRFMTKDDFPRTWWNMNVTPKGTIVLEMVDAEKARCHAESQGAIVENTWNHLAVVGDREKRTVTFYLNGKKDVVRAMPDDFTGSLDIAGRDLVFGSSWHPYIGLLDEIRIYRRLRSNEEIKATFEEEKTLRATADYKLVE